MFANVYTIFWIIAVVVFAVVEAGTVTLVSVWFIAGALAALLAAILGAALWLQIVLFLVVSAVLLAALRPFVKKYVTPKKTATNSDRVVGMEGVVSEKIDNLRAKGAVKVAGVEWTARAESGEEIPVGTVVKVNRIEGVKVYVERATVPAGA